MAEEILVKEQLTDSMVRAGEELLKRLKSTDLEIVAAFWLYTSETNSWQLMLVSPQVDSQGPRRAYAQVRGLLHDAAQKPIGLDLSDITVLGSNENLARAVAGANRLWGDLSGKRLRNTGMDGIYVDDIYVYFVNDSAIPPHSSTLFTK